MKTKRAFRTRRDLVSIEEACSILEPHVTTLLRTVHAAWEWVQRLLSEDPERRASFDVATIAAMVYDRFVALVDQAFEEVQGVQAEKRARMLTLCFDRRVALRFKKLDSRLRSRNVATNRQELIYHQQLEMAGIADPPTRLTLGYVTDATNQVIENVSLTCPEGWGKNRWVLTLHNSTGTEGLPFRPIATEAIEEPAVKVVSRNRSRQAKDGA